MYIRIYLFIYIFYLSWCMLGGGVFEWKQPILVIGGLIYFSVTSWHAKICEFDPQ